MPRLALVALMIAGCAETNNIAPMFPQESPYVTSVRQQQTGPGTWQISADVNTSTSRSTAVGYTYLRAAELCQYGFEIAVPTQIAYGGYNGGFVATIGIACKPGVCVSKTSWCTAYNGACFSSQNACEAYRTDAVASCSETPLPQCQLALQPCATYPETACSPSGCYWSPPTCWQYERQAGRDGSACVFCE